LQENKANQLFIHLRKTNMKTTIKIAVLLAATTVMSKPAQASFSKVAPESIFCLNPVLSWKTDDVQLGEIQQNKPVTIDFEFTNTGKTPVIITNVQAACGCTATDYSRLPVLPGQTTKITATFNAAAKGAFKKTVTVTTNAEDTPKVLSFSGTVI
jgi:hypothetical protein